MMDIISDLIQKCLLELYADIYEVSVRSYRRQFTVITGKSLS
jgi:hypothetical protein